MYFAETNDHAIFFFFQCKNSVSLQSLYYECVCSLMYDVNKNTAPDNILKLFSRISSVRTYKTRASTSERFCTKESRLNVPVPMYFCNIFQILNKVEVEEEQLNIILVRPPYVNVM